MTPMQSRFSMMLNQLLCFAKKKLRYSGTISGPKFAQKSFNFCFLAESIFNLIPISISFKKKKILIAR
jgi:hypothetical protein